MVLVITTGAEKNTKQSSMIQLMMYFIRIKNFLYLIHFFLFLASDNLFIFLFTFLNLESHLFSKYIPHPRTANIKMIQNQHALRVNASVPKTFCAAAITIARRARYPPKYLPFIMPFPILGTFCSLVLSDPSKCSSFCDSLILESSWIGMMLYILSLSLDWEYYYTSYK